MKAIILGSRSGFGSKLKARWISSSHTVIGLNRPDYDLADELTMIAAAQKITEEAPDVFVLNSFNHKGKEQQLRALEIIWPRVKHLPLTFVAVGSISAHFDQHRPKVVDYAAAKKAFCLRAMQLGWKRMDDPIRQARMILYDPGSFINIKEEGILKDTNSTFLSYDEGFTMLEKVMELKLPLIRISGIGTEP